MKALLRLPAVDLERLADAIGAGRLHAPLSAHGISWYLTRPESGAVAAALDAVIAEGSSLRSVASWLRALAELRREAEARTIDLVWSGPEAEDVPSRDTGAVVRELFAAAEQRVLVAGYAVHQGREVFAALAARMQQRPGLDVQFFLDVRREHAAAATPAAEVLRAFADEFRSRHWPGPILPRVSYDPRSLDLDPHRRSSLHAKCVVVDGQVAFVSSANFTEAAQRRNIEAGVLIREPGFARRLEGTFLALARSGLLVPVLEA